MNIQYTRGVEFKNEEYGIITSLLTKEEEDNSFSDMDYLFGGLKKRKPVYCELLGIPFKVCLVNIPFMLISLPSGRRVSIDIREYNFTRCTPEYFEEFGKIVRENSPKPIQGW